MSIQTHNLTVLGTGVLGAQIAFHSAFKGKQVVAYNPDEKELDKCRQEHEKLANIYLDEVGASTQEIAQTKARISYHSDLAQAVANADLVIEAVPEVPAIKTQTYQALNEHLPEHTIVFTNTSSLMPSEFAQQTGRPDKFAALHFANMIWQVNVVEIMGHEHTSKLAFEVAATFAIEIGMLPIAVGKENPGYVLNFG